MREEGQAQAAFGHEDRYMLHEGDVVPDVDQTANEYSRPFRSLRLWMALGPRRCPVQSLDRTHHH